MRRLSDGRWMLALALLACLGAGTIGAFLLGQYIGWDQRNYHVYVPYSFLNGGLQRDGAPAGSQSFNNPLPFLFWYWMLRVWPPVWVGIVTGAIQSISLWLGLVACWIVTRGVRPGLRVGCLACAFVISLCSPMLTENLGSSFIDLMLAGPVLAGVVLVLLAGPEPAGRSFARRPLLCCAGAGLFAGVAVGLKLTNATFVVALAACVLVGWSAWRQRLLALLCYGAASALGCVACLGPWALHLWRIHGNPIFPYYNALFRSADFPFVNVRDARYLPHTLLEALAYPLRIATAQPETSEYGLRDWRYLMLFAAAGFTVVALAWHRSRAKTATAPAAIARRRLAVFLVVAWVVWLPQFAVLRYMFPFELLIGAAVAALAVEGAAVRLPLLLPPVMAAVAIVTFQPNYPARRPWPADWFEPRGFTELPVAGVYFLDDWALGYLAALLPAGSRLFLPDRSVESGGMPMAAGDATVFARRMRAAVEAAEAPPLVAIAYDSLSWRLREVLGGYGLGFTGACRMVATRMDRLLACDLSRGQPPGLAAAIIDPGRDYRLDDPASGAVFVTALRNMPAVSRAMLDHGLVFRLPAASALQVTVGGAWPAARIAMRAGGRIVATHDAGGSGELTACLPASVLGPGNTAALAFELAGPPVGPPPPSGGPKTLRIALAPDGSCPP